MKKKRLVQLHHYPIIDNPVSVDLSTSSKTCAARSQSANVLYSGAGASLMTSALSSTKTPWWDRYLNTVLIVSEPMGNKRRDNCAPRCPGSLGVMIENPGLLFFFLCVICSSGTKNSDDFRSRSNPPVSLIERSLMGCIIPADLKIFREPRREAIARTQGLDCWNPCAPLIGEKVDGIANRVSSS